MSVKLRLWTRDELVKFIELAETTYSTANKLAEVHGKKIYEGLMSVLNLRGSTEAAVKYSMLQWRTGMPIAILSEKSGWEINVDFLSSLLYLVDPRANVDKIIKKGEPDYRRFVGTTRLNIAGGWGEIIAFYILNSPHPRMDTIIYLLHMSIYVDTFLTATISEVYTASEEFLGLIENVHVKKGAIEFLTRLLRRRYIPEDLYSLAIEAVENRRELHFTSIRDLLREEEARLYLAESLLAGRYGVVEKLYNVLERYNGKMIPREEIASVAGEVYSLVSGLERAVKDYRIILDKLNELLVSSGKDIDAEILKKVIEEIAVGR